MLLKTYASSKLRERDEAVPAAHHTAYFLFSRYLTCVATFHSFLGKEKPQVELLHFIEWLGTDRFARGCAGPRNAIAASARAVIGKILFSLENSAWRESNECCRGS
jgi:hypothetical protein